MIQVNKPILGFKEILRVVKVIRSGILTQGKEVELFEREFSKYVSNRLCVAVNSGTSALQLALMSLGIGKGDEVLVPAFTFAASANAVKLVGANPKFVDVNLKDFNLDTTKIVNLINKKTKAILVVHLFGLPCNMEEISSIAKSHNLLIIEDAAQAHLAGIDENRVGTFGDAAAFSFYPTKNMTTGEGGMVVLKEKNSFEIVRMLRNQGMRVKYKNELVGFNMRLSEIHAAIGIEQLKRLPNWTSRRQQIALRYLREIKNEYVILPKSPSNYAHVYHQFTLRVPKYRHLLEEWLRLHHIGSAIYYPTSVPALPSYRINEKFKNSIQLSKEVLSIPIHPTLKSSDISSIIRVINRFSPDK